MVCGITRWQKEDIVTLLFTFFIGLGITNLSYASLPEDFQQLDANYKRDIIWNNIESTRFSGHYPNHTLWSVARDFVVFRLTSFNFLEKTFTTTSDEMPYHITHSGEIKYRPKIIHTRGATALVRFIPSGENNYTGVFKKETIGMARISLADPINFNPGMGLKFFVDGKPSVNVAVMKSLTTNVKNCDPFFYEFSNVIPKTGFFLGIAAFAFEDVAQSQSPTGEATTLSVKHFGRIYDATKPSSPFQLVFKPSKDSDSLGFSCDKDFRKVLESMQPGQKLYEVYAKKSPESVETVKVGELYLDSSFVASSYGDEVLFFQHHIEPFEEK